jgi:hypothetical protein
VDVGGACRCDGLGIPGYKIFFISCCWIATIYVHILIYMIDM